MILRQNHMWRDFSLYIMLHALPFATCLLKCIHINAKGLGPKKISIKKFRSHSTYSPTLSRATNSKIILELAIHVSFEIFPRDRSSTKSKYVSTREFYFICPVIQFASLYPFNTVGYCCNAWHSFKYYFKYSKLYLLPSNEFIWDHLWTDSV